MGRLNDRPKGYNSDIVLKPSQIMVEECEMSMKILGPGSPGFSLGLGRAIKKEQPETHGNKVKSHVAPYLSA